MSASARDPLALPAAGSHIDRILPSALFPKRGEASARGRTAALGRLHATNVRRLLGLLPWLARWQAAGLAEDVWTFRCGHHHAGAQLAGDAGARDMPQTEEDASQGWGRRRTPLWAPSTAGSPRAAWAADLPQPPSTSARPHNLKARRRWVPSRTKAHSMYRSAETPRARQVAAMPGNTQARWAPPELPAKSALSRCLATFWNSLSGRVVDGDVGVVEEAQERGLVGDRPHVLATVRA
ncbi:MAG: hypothetical protein RLZZ450_535 [Pseudomonadota bacterium]